MIYINGTKNNEECYAKLKKKKKKKFWYAI